MCANNGQFLYQLNSIWLVCLLYRSGGGVISRQMVSHPKSCKVKETCPKNLDVRLRRCAGFHESQPGKELTSATHSNLAPSLCYICFKHISKDVAKKNNFQNLEKKGLLPHIKIFSQSHTPIPPENISQSWKGGWSNWLDDGHTWHCWEKVKTFIERGHKGPKNMTIATICHSFPFQIGMICIIWEKLGACVNLW